MKTAVVVTTHSHERQRGVALVMVLWLSLFLSVILAGTLATARIETKITLAARDRFKAEEAARGALELAAWRLATAQAGQDINEIIPIETIIGDIEVTVSWSPELRKTDLNLASEETLTRLIELQTVMASENALGIAANIADWRDSDDDARPTGAERRDYTNAPEGKIIANRAFMTSGELSQVLGVSDEIFLALKDEITVYGPDVPLLDDETVESLRAGERLLLAGRTENIQGYVQHWRGIARLTGAREKPYEWISLKQVFPDE